MLHPPTSAASKALRFPFLGMEIRPSVCYSVQIQVPKHQPDTAAVKGLYCSTWGASAAVARLL